MNKDYPAALGSGAKGIPVAQFHGTRDEIVRFTWGQNRSVNSLLLGVNPFVGAGTLVRSHRT